MKTIIKLAATGLYVGYCPFFPGTLGSMLGLLIYLCLLSTPALYLAVTIMIIVLGFLIAGRAEEIFGKKDSRRIVIDEIASMCLVYLFIRPEIFMIIAGFVLLRVFDIIKPWPAKNMEGLSGSAGIMMDDIIAACYTVAALFMSYIIKQAGILG